LTAQRRLWRGDGDFPHDRPRLLRVDLGGQAIRRFELSSTSQNKLPVEYTEPMQSILNISKSLCPYVVTYERSSRRIESIIRKTMVSPIPNGNMGFVEHGGRLALSIFPTLSGQTDQLIEAYAAARQARFEKANES
jgi:hypothetical protein